MIFVSDKPKLARSHDENKYSQNLLNDDFKPLYSSQATGIKVIGGTQRIENLDSENPLLIIENNDSEEITIIVGAEVHESTTMPTNVLESARNKLKNISNVSEIKQRNLEWWKNYWEASYIQLESDDSLAAMYEQIWYMQLYLMASSNRGKYPAKMNGSIWTVDQDEQPWGGGYWHFNQNTMHGALLAANHPEYTRRYTDRISDNVGILKAQTKDLWRNEGIFVHETHSPDVTFYEFDRLPI